MVPVRIQQAASTWCGPSETIVKTANADEDTRLRNEYSPTPSTLSIATTTDEEDPTGENMKIAHFRSQIRLSLVKDPGYPAGRQTTSSGSILSEYIIQFTRRFRWYVIKRCVVEYACFSSNDLAYRKATTTHRHSSTASVDFEAVHLQLAPPISVVCPCLRTGESLSCSVSVLL